jgi:short-subunit dehydrogenase
VDLNSERLIEMARAYPGAQIHVLDQRDRAQVEAFCDAVIASGAFIDVAVLNAGMLVIGNLADLTRDEMLDQIQVNLCATALLAQCCAKRMGEAGKGHIMATVSMGGIVALKGSATYSASKFGLRGLLFALKDELAGKGVHVTGIYPAGVDTPMLRHEALHGGSALNFVGKPVTAEDVACAYERALDRGRRAARPRPGMRSRCSRSGPRRSSSSRAGSAAIRMPCAGPGRWRGWDRRRSRRSRRRGRISWWPIRWRRWSKA